ncbi:MAG: ASKHA domain-containing protein [Verrucomicrobiota bacterium]
MSRPPHLQIELESGERRDIPAPSGGRSLADALAAHGLPLNTRCGQRGLCRGCEVKLRSGELTVNDTIVTVPATVQACRAKASAAATIFIPARSRIEHKPQVGETFEIAIPYAHQPLFAPVSGGRDTAFAVDVGTTTVVVLLVDLVSGEVLSRAGAFNEQIRFGDNVITRIEAARLSENLAALQRAIVMETIKPLLVNACERAGRSLDRIAGGAIAGNTTMLHLLVGEDPTSLGIAPFTPRFIEGKRFTAGKINLSADGLAPETPVQLLPGIGAYIGADITAGVYASGMVFDPTPSLLVDIGTNGEIVLQNGGQLTACATAAGPAFEGCGLRCGTRAREGAVSDLNLKLNPFQFATEVIGNVPLARANGICGSAYVDFLATARSSGLLGFSGRFVKSAWENLPARNRFTAEGEQAFRLVADGGSGELRISEVDVALLLQAKAAIGAGIETLLETAGIKAANLGRVYLAGGFGMHLNVPHAIAIGLLPGFRAEQVRVVGNTALAGALLALVDRMTLAEMENLRRQVEVVELNLADGFEDRYVEHLMLP